MTLPGTAVQYLSVLRDEFPNVAILSELKFQNPECFRKPHLAVRLDGKKAFQVPPSGSHRKLSDPVLWIAGPAGILGRETLVMMHVTIQHDIRVGFIQILP